MASVCGPRGTLRGVPTPCNQASAAVKSSATSSVHVGVDVAVAGDAVDIPLCVCHVACREKFKIWRRGECTAFPSWTSCTDFRQFDATNPVVSLPPLPTPAELLLSPSEWPRPVATDAMATSGSTSSTGHIAQCGARRGLHHHQWQRCCRRAAGALASGSLAQKGDHVCQKIKR